MCSSVDPGAPSFPAPFDGFVGRAPARAWGLWQRLCADAGNHRLYPWIFLFQICNLFCSTPACHKRCGGTHRHLFWYIHAYMCGKDIREAGRTDRSGVAAHRSTPSASGTTSDLCRLLWTARVYRRANTHTCSHTPAQPPALLPRPGRPIAKPARAAPGHSGPQP